MTAHAAIHTGLRQLGIEQDAARDLYARVTGERSLRKMTAVQHQSIIDELRRLGFKPASSGSRRPLEGRYAKTLQALWIAAWNLGLAGNRDDRALIAFVKRQTGIDHVRFVRDHDDASKAIEGLKAWMAREAGVEWRHDRFLPDWTQIFGYRIAVAQFRRLRDADAGFRDFVELQHWIIAEIDADMRIGDMTDQQWHTVMNTLGERLRKAMS